MIGALKGIRIYLDTHIIDYLYDHRKDYWEDIAQHTSISNLARIDHSSHINDLLALYWFLTLTYIDDFVLIIGNRVLGELEKITDDDRRSRLLKYAEGIRHFYSVIKWDEYNESREPDPQYYTTFLSQVLSKMNKKDRRLYTEAIENKLDPYVIPQI
jgi:hypothetical protein